MLRLILAFALPAASLALAAVSLAGKGLLTEPGGEPMLVADLSGTAGLAPAGLGGDDCAARLHLTEDAQAGAPDAHILALALQPRPGGLAVAIQEIPAGAPDIGASLYLAVDAQGRILGVSETADFGLGGAAPVGDCLPAAETPVPGAV